MSNSIYPCVWFNGNAKQAAEWYAEAFSDVQIVSDSGLVVIFRVGDCQVMGLNGGPMFTPNASISFFTSFEDDAAIEKAWQKLQDGGSVLMPLNKYPWSDKYGWVQDRFGVSWQLIKPRQGVITQRLVPAMMFTQAMAGKAEEAMQFYTSVFPNAAVTDISRYEKGEGDVEGTVKHARFTLQGQSFVAMDSSMAHAFAFNEGISIVVNCSDQQEIDHYWSSLTGGGGAESRCGWLKDRYGVSWQIVPENIGALLAHPQKGEKAMQALMKMNKIELDQLENPL